MSLTGLVLRTVLGAAASLLVLYLALQGLDLQPEELLTSMEGASGLGLISAQLLMSAGMIGVALRWRALLGSKAVLPALDLTAITCGSLLINYAAPGPVGELAAGGLLRHLFGLPVLRGVAAQLAGRLVGLGLGAVLALCLILASDPLRQSLMSLPGGLPGLGLMLLASGGGLWLLRSPQHLERLSELLRRWPRLQRVSASALSALRVLEDLPVKAWRSAGLWALFSHSCVGLGLWLGALSMGLEPRVEGVLVAYLLSAAAVVLLFAMPGAQIGWDALFLTLLAQCAGLEAGEALLLTAFQRLQQLGLMLLGALALVGMGMSDRIALEESPPSH